MENGWWLPSESAQRMLMHMVFEMRTVRSAIFVRYANAYAYDDHGIDIGALSSLGGI